MPRLKIICPYGSGTFIDDDIPSVGAFVPNSPKDEPWYVKSVDLITSEDPEYYRVVLTKDAPAADDDAGETEE